MHSRTKWLVAISLLIVASMILASCAPTAEPTEEAAPAEPVAEPTEAMPAEEPAAAGGIYRVGVFEDITTPNYFAANGPDNTVWNSYMLPERLTLYWLSDKRFDFIPYVATALPEPLAEENGKWVVTIPIRDNIVWSDGTPFTANDLAFTANTAVKFGLISGSWSSWYDSNYLESIEAVGDYTVKIIYHTKPGLARHEWGTLQAPILAKHFWEPLAAEAAAPIDALAADASEEDKAAAQGEATDLLFAIDSTGEPFAGAYQFGKWEKAAFLETDSRGADYFFNGTKITEYANGAHKEDPGETYYGTAEGDVALEVSVGPFVDKVVYAYYAAQDAAILALQNGDVDFVLNPLGLQRGLAARVEGDPNLSVLANNVNGFRYLSFNVRREPMKYIEFRQAVAVLIDKEFVTNTILQGVAFPLYSFVPEANAAWYFDDVPKWGLKEDGTPMTREERVNKAIELLEAAGFSWEGDKKPAWDEENRYVTPSGALLMPDGKPVPELDLLAPSPGYDPLRSTFAIWIERWCNEMGIPVKANLAGFNVIVPKIFTEQDFDMYILGWSLSIFPSYMRDFWHTEQAVPDGNNAGGYSNPEFDAASTELMTCESQEACKVISDNLQTILSTDVPYVLLFDTGIIEAYRSASVTYPYTEHLSGLQYVHQGPMQGMQARVTVK